MDEKRPRRISIAVDMDGVLADTETHFIQYYEAESGEKVDRNTLLGVPESQSLSRIKQLFAICAYARFFQNTSVYSGSVYAIKTLMEDFDVFIVSAAMEFPLSLYEKKQWLEEHFPFISWKNIVFCGDKSIIKTDYLIDDHLKNLDNFTGIPLLFTASHNVHVTSHHRLNNWDEILVYFSLIKIMRLNDRSVEVWKCGSV